MTQSPAWTESLPPVRGRLVTGEPLAPFTWLRVGGPADVLFLPAAMLKVGTRIDEFLVYVGTRTLEPEARQASAIAARRHKLFAGEGHWRQRLVEPLCVVDIHSGKLPDGGIVVSFSDVTETVAAAEASNSEDSGDK